jgi:8-oxo-dGTP pyrophosphatase MutT (NUDIX family)
MLELWQSNPLRSFNRMPSSPYVRALRDRIGHDLLMLQSVSVMLFDGARLMLAQHRDTGLWVTIGGAIEPDETPADAVVRECWEETGILVEPTDVLGVFGGPEFRILYPNGDVASYTAPSLKSVASKGNRVPTESKSSHFGSSRAMKLLLCQCLRGPRPWSDGLLSAG